MNLLRIFGIFLIFGGYVLPVFADRFPETAIRKELGEARTTVVVDPTTIKPGHLRIVHFMGRNVLIYHRTLQDMAYLRAGTTDRLANPDDLDFRAVINDQYLNSISIAWTRVLLVMPPRLKHHKFRSLDDEYFVASEQTPLGCVVHLAPLEMRPFPAAPFFGVCSGLWFDVAGRVLKNEWTPPPARSKALAHGNLLIPPYHFTAEGKLVIGLSPKTKIPEINDAAIRAAAYARESKADVLAHAAAYNDIRMVNKLLDAGAPVINAPGRPNPLDGAVLGGSDTMVLLLLGHGARPTKNTYTIADLQGRDQLKSLIHVFAKTTNDIKSGKDCINYGTHGNKDLRFPYQCDSLRHNSGL